ncbi:MAG: ParB/RepB/Spo0J family partition protein [Synergistaceae bacterium]|nr:ParB/RepB/Spo0J family partition protein [Synergistaceae bacterium]
MAKSRALGKGLGALFPSASVDAVPSATREEESRGGTVLPLDSIIPNPLQPRRTMDEGGIEDLARSIGTHGILQPLVVRLREKGEYELVAGERRWRAARLAGLKEAPVRIVEGTDLEMMEISLIENIQREDLSPLEVAAALSDLLKSSSLTQEEAAARIGWSRTALTNKLRLLQLPVEVKDLLSANLLAEGHARPLLSLESPAVMISLALRAAEKGLSVRQVEEAVKLANRQVPEVKISKRFPSRFPNRSKGPPGNWA